MDLIDKSFEYVKRRCNEDNKDITRKAFLAGARSFYEEFDVDKYIDLDLPSKTLWADWYHVVNGKLDRYRFFNGNDKLVPTLDQVQELIDNCIWKVMGKYAYCVGRNGKSLRWIRYESCSLSNWCPYIALWVRDRRNEYYKCMIYIRDNGTAAYTTIPTGYVQTHPVRNVKIKQ